MPRINIDEKWWSDTRRIDLILKLGKHTADGVFINFIRRSQEFCGDPFDASKEFSLKEINAMIVCGLAEGTPKSLYIFGSKERHEWIKKRRDSAKKGGKNSGISRASSKEINNLENPIGEVNNYTDLCEAKRSKTKQTQPSSSSSKVTITSTNYVLEKKLLDKSSSQKKNENISKFEFNCDEKKQEIIKALGDVFKFVPRSLKNSAFEIHEFYEGNLDHMRKELKDLHKSAEVGNKGARWLEVAILKKVGVIGD